MTDWDTHHPPHDHPDFDAYLNSLTDDDLEAINAAIPDTGHQIPDTPDDQPKN